MHTSHVTNTILTQAIAPPLQFSRGFEEGIFVSIVKGFVRAADVLDILGVAMVVKQGYCGDGGDGRAGILMLERFCASGWCVGPNDTSGSLRPVGRRQPTPKLLCSSKKDILDYYI